MELLNHVHQVVGASVMQEEQALARSPQRRGAELIRPCGALGYAIRQFGSHVVKREIREGRKRGVVEVSEDGWAGGEFGGVAGVAAGGVELGLPVDGGGAERRGIAELRWAPDC